MAVNVHSLEGTWQTTGEFKIVGAFFITRICVPLVRVGYNRNGLTALMQNHPRPHRDASYKRLILTS